ncbi:MAG: tRNA (pseudouridine(54)-N(1))-methyltransferase TrmY [Methanomassiliicoccales archaeon]|jgi:tRNA (pseudouridine54-N1)-methyltransferase|nr:tRNA (pseudouridine(54)-N(1))-methyltransferase TrmY [Methanomassiliicoccales archaeon]
MVREFILYSRTGKTDGNFKDLYEAGRLDVVHQCILMAIYESYASRKDVIFHAILNGPPDPPKELLVESNQLQDAPPQERNWENLIKKVLSGKSHPGITVKKNSFQALIKTKRNVFVLEKKGKDIWEIEIGEDPVFVLGDQIGLPKNEERFALRRGIKISLGEREYTSAQCICILNYVLDRLEKSS